MNTRNVSTTASSSKTNTSEHKGKSVTPIKDVVCFKCHGHGPFKVNCPNNRAFTLAEWEEIRSTDRPKTIHVSINGREEERGTVTNEEDPDGTYIVKESRAVTPYASDSESDREPLYPEEERHKVLVIRRSFHTTPKGKKSYQRENIFQTKCRINAKLCDLIIHGGEVRSIV